MNYKKSNEDQAKTNGVIDKSRLAQLMLDWERDFRALQELEKKIIAWIVLGAETIITGNVRGRYSKGRANYDYEAGVMTQIKNAELMVSELQEAGEDPKEWEGHEMDLCTILAIVTEHSTVTENHKVNWSKVADELMTELFMTPDDVPSTSAKPSAKLMLED